MIVKHPNPDSSYWHHGNTHDELVKNKKQFGLLYSHCLESGSGFPTLYMGDTLVDIQAQISELVVAQKNMSFSSNGGICVIGSEDFHSMSFQVIKSHHRQFYETIRTETSKKDGQS